MNLYLRLIWAAFRSWRLPAIEAGDWIERRLRVLPNDLDINGHRETWPIRAKGFRRWLARRA